MGNINRPQKPQSFLLYCGLVVFLIVTFACFYSFKVELSYLLNELVSNKTILTYDKDIFFGLGGGLIIGFFTLPSSYLIIFNRPKPKQKTANNFSKLYIFISIIALIIMFVLPSFASNYLDDYMNNRGYTICNIPKVKMILYRDVTYTNSAKLCEALITKQCEEHSWMCR